MVLAGQCLRKKLDPTMEQLWSQCTSESLPFRDPLLQDGPRVLLGFFLSSSPALLLPSAFFFFLQGGEPWRKSGFLLVCSLTGAPAQNSFLLVTQAQAKGAQSCADLEG